jgi:hypothetical protein
LSRRFTCWTTFSNISKFCISPMYCTYDFVSAWASRGGVCHDLRSSGMLSRAVWQNYLPWIWGQHFSAKRLYPYTIPHDITSCETPITNTVVTSLQGTHRVACVREIFLFEKATKMLFFLN